MVSNTLYIIPARKGSKGLPGKNVKVLGGKPLIEYSLDFARQYTTDAHICISTNDEAVIHAVNNVGYKETFLRSELLSTDEATSADVIKDAIARYNTNGHYKYVTLLQPTTPFRNAIHYEEAVQKIKNADMVVGVKLSKANPYFNLFEEDDKGNLQLSKGIGNVTRRQDAPCVYEINGALYLYTINTAMSYNNLSSIPSIKYVIMNDAFSIDIDTILDWQKAEYYLNHTIN